MLSENHDPEDKVFHDEQKSDKDPHPSKDDNRTQSRLLTQQQLSDMAFNMRELSKRLGGLKHKLRVKNVFLLTKAHDETLIGKTRELSHWLLHEEANCEYTMYEFFRTNETVIGF